MIFHERCNFWGNSIIAWGGIYLNEGFNQVIIHKESMFFEHNIADILEPHVLSFTQNYCPDFFFQDNAYEEEEHGFLTAFLPIFTNWDDAFIIWILQIGSFKVQQQSVFGKAYTLTL